MKKNDVILLIAVAAYSFLFYRQNAGINFLLFSILLVILLLIKNRDLVKSRNWLLSALAVITSGIFVFMHGNPFTVTMNIISIALIAALSFKPNTSVVLGLLYTAYSSLSSYIYIILDIVESKKKRSPDEKGPFWPKLLMVLAIAGVIITLFLLYRESNAVFKDFTKDINLDFISLPWVFFTLGGFLLMYGFFYPRFIFPGLDKYDETTDGLPSNDNNIATKAHRREEYAGITLLALVNLMILVLNILDGIYLWGGKALPTTISLSESLHQGVWSLILSIIIAISIILYFFRKQALRAGKNKTLILLALVWIAQNIMMAVSTSYRDYLYIADFGLTYKRIGVYIWLSIAIAGLISTLIKIIRVKRNWYLFRFNGWSSLAILLAACSFNWDTIITRHNLSHQVTVDKVYLINLSYANLPLLLNLAESNYFNEVVPENSYYSNDKRFENNQNLQLKNLVYAKLYRFLEMYDNSCWKSVCLDDEVTYSKIMQMIDSGKLSNLEISDAIYITDTKPLHHFRHLKKLQMLSNTENFNDLVSFTELTDLDLKENALDSINGIAKLQKLKRLNLSGNFIADIRPLKDLKELEYIDISKNPVQTNVSGAVFYDPDTIIAHKSNLRKCAMFKGLDKMKVLDVSDNGITDITELSTLSSLEVLDVSGNSIDNFSALSELTRLKKVYISDCGDAFYAGIKAMLPGVEIIKKKESSEYNVAKR